MWSILKYETKVNVKQLLIWALAVGGMGLVCILLYKSMEGSMADMAESFASMGAFADAFGMSQLSIASIKGFFATEVGTIHSLGGAMFAASIATVALSKEEDGHTAEFTFALPVSRIQVVAMKYLSVLLNILLFTGICLVLYEIGFLYIGAEDIGADFMKFMLLQFAMNIEIATICFAISAINRKNKLGIGIALALVLYFFDLLSRVVPDMEDMICLTPFSFSNAADIFTKSGNIALSLGIGITISVLCLILAVVIYDHKDLAS